MTEPYHWLDTRQAAIRSNFAIDTVKRAANAGHLHGHQRVVGGKWRFRPECVDAWVTGEKCEHQRRERRTA